MVDGNDPQDAPTVELARRLIMGFRTTQLVHIAARLGIADLLKDGPQGASALATAVGAHPRALYRLLRALASLGIFAETTDGRFDLTPLAQTLRSDVPGSLRPLALLYGDEWLWTAYGRTLYSIMTGLPAFDQVHGQTLFDYLHLHPPAALTFDQGMTAYSEQEAAAVLRAYDFSGASTLVDVGGGQGALLAAILTAYPQAYGILFEHSSVIDRARHVMAHAGLADRCAMKPGDFFEAVPDGGDVYLLKSILHNWDDGRSTTILKNCRNVMRRSSRILIIERIVPDGNEPSEAKLFDVNMLVILGGLERTKTEYESLLEEAGFHLTQVIPTRAPVSILEGVPRTGSSPDDL
jgi:O-methyltransferase domain/Dimerisation domain